VSVRWVNTKPLQDVFDMGKDPIGRPTAGFNILILKQPSDSLELEVAAVLQGASVATFGENMFAGSDVEIPAGEGPFLSVIATGGLQPIRTHTSKYRYPAVQVSVMAEDYLAAVVMANAAFAVLEDVQNADVEPLVP